MTQSGHSTKRGLAPVEYLDFGTYGGNGGRRPFAFWLFETNLDPVPRDARDQMQAIIDFGLGDEEERERCHEMLDLNLHLWAHTLSSEVTLIGPDKLWTMGYFRVVTNHDRVTRDTRMNRKTKELRIDAPVQSISIEELAKEIEGVAFGHSELETIDPESLKDLLERLPKKPDVGSLFRNKGGK